MNDDELDTMISEFMEQGLVEPVFHVDGSVGMRVVPSEDNPLWHLHLESIGEDIQHMLELGIIEIAGVNEQGELYYLPTEYGRKLLEES